MEGSPNKAFEETHRKVSYGSTTSMDQSQQRRSQLMAVSIRGYVCIGTLFLINLLNYMDRYTLSAVLTQVQSFFGIDDAQGGLLQTVFIVFYMVFAPLCGFLGDRYNRKWIMTVGITVWVAAVIASSFVPRQHFIIFLLLRGVVGIGEASYVIIAPTIISDMFSKTVRSRVLMFFYFAIPLGSGLGYIVGSYVATAFGAWYWGLRVTPVIGFFCLLLIVFVVEEPERGAADRADGAKAATEQKQTSYFTDIKEICKVKSYMTSTIGYISIVFATGTLSWWAPTAIEHAAAAREFKNSTSELSSSEKNHVSLVFGGITVAGGILGVLIGAIWAEWWKRGKYFFSGIQTFRADALVCGIGSICAMPFLFSGFYMVKLEPGLSWVLFFFCVTFLCLNWSVNVDMLMYIVTPKRRSVANSWQILMSHLFGDASGPYIIGLLSDAIRGKDDTPSAHYDSLVYAFYIPNAVLIIGFVFYMIAAKTVVEDKAKVDAALGLNDTNAKYVKKNEVNFYNGKESGLDNGTFQSD
ncbi:hypothetical protein QR680_006585 [Steinernema hermaphroditum]|uniref:Major facilitator superfamily (MFS) profile domain-containing protein n=1 Tax=Steinernema hermaphroditum TaxID=289476 RepID=A0AA39HW15_9BILA|nr:hypothetical protein QR680_006585 [Steinernema hermaphroditum]